ERITPFVQKLDIKLAAIEKGGFDHFMLKEIFEQPQTIFDLLRGRMDAEHQAITLSGIDKVADKLLKANRIIIVACETSWYACLLAEYVNEELSRINLEVEYSSELRYTIPSITDQDNIIASSYNSDTTYTLVALENAK